MAKEALSLDLDGVIVARIPFQWAAVPRLLKRPPLDFSPPTDIPLIERTVVEQRLGLKDHINYIRHSMPVTREARQVIPELAQTMDIYGNSGRVNTSAWVEKAEEAFKRAGIKDHFKGVYFKPPGTRGLLSKMAAVAELRDKYDSVTHVDDNPQDALPIAKAFPDVKVIILQDLSTGLLVSMKELQQYPNVRRVARLSDLLPARQGTKSNSSVSETRNSKLRELTAIPIQTVTDRLHQTFPSLTPNQITALGAIGTAIGSAMAARGEADSKAMPLSVLATSALLDAFDGALARKIETEKPGSIDFKKGAVYDSLSDRTQELLMALSRALQAHKRGDKLGQISALLNGVSNSLPSTAKAYAETRGVAVAESGKGVAGFLGTRVGRATIGLATTVFPEVRGVPIQVIADALVTSANLSTAIDRMGAARTQEVTLSGKTRTDSKVRFKALATFTALALGAAAVTYLHLRKTDNPRTQTEETEATTDEEKYIQILSDIEEYCHQHQLDHRFVGGTLTDLIGSQTELDIDVGTRTIRLAEPNRQTMIRPDGTVKDIDLVIFSDNLQAFAKAKETFESWPKIAQEANMAFPQISIEATYHPNWPRRNKLKQFVSAFEMDEEGKLYLAFGDTTQQISQESIEPWQVILENGARLTVFNPLAHRLCYELRVPSGLKPKDLDKMPTLVGFSDRVIEEGAANGVDYADMYEDWQSYILKLRNHPDLLTRLKAGITGLYWRTLGTQIAHGSGILGGLSKFNNKMNG